MRYYPFLLLCLWIPQNKYQNKKQHSCSGSDSKLPPILFSMCARFGYSKGKEALLHTSSLLFVKITVGYFAESLRNCLTHVILYVIMCKGVAKLLCLLSIRPVQSEVRQHHLYD